MKIYGVDVTYRGTITERTVVIAENEEEAKEKIKNGYIDDVLDEFTETEEIIDFDFFQEDEEDK